MQVLTCNTTAVQFVSREGGRSSPSAGPSGGSAAPAFPLHELPCLPKVGAPRQVRPADGPGTSGLSKTQSCRISFTSERSQE